MRAILASGFALVLATSLVTGCAPAQSPAAPLDMNAERAALMKVDADFSALSVAKGTQAAFGAYLADDAKSFSPGQLMTGREAIVADLAPPPGRPPATLSWIPAGAEISSGADLGYTWGSYTLATTNAEGAKVERHGKYVTVWKRAPGQAWKISADIGNADPK